MHQARQKRFFYGWIIVIACFFVTFSYGLFYTFGIFFKPLQAEFGWGRGLTSSIHSIHLATFAFSTILMGRLTDKYGPRMAITLGAVLVGIGISLCSRVSTVGQFYLFYAVASFGAGVIWAPPTATVQRWFIKRRGLTLGLVAAGVGAGMLVYAPLAEYLISAYGWRTSYIILGVGTGLILALTASVMVRSPTEKGLKPYGGEEPTPGTSSATEDASLRGNCKASGSEEWTTKEAIKTKAFLGTSILYLATLLPIHMIAVHLVPYATDLGVSEAVAANAFGLVGAFSIAGRIGMSSAADKIGWKWGLVICCGGCTAMLLWLTGVSSLWMLYLFVVLYGFLYGGKVPLLPGLIGSFFGTRSLAEITGTIHAISMLGAAVGPFLGGWIFDRTESYFIAFVICAALWALAAVISAILKPPRKMPESLGIT